MVSSYVEGSQDEKSFVKLWTDYHNTTFPLKEATALPGGGVHLLFEKESEEKT